LDIIWEQPNFSEFLSSFVEAAYAGLANNFIYSLENCLKPLLKASSQTIQSQVYAFI
jgi:hypothetical protein